MTREETAQKIVWAMKSEIDGEVYHVGRSLLEIERGIVDALVERDQKTDVLRAQRDALFKEIEVANNLMTLIAKGSLAFRVVYEWRQRPAVRTVLNHE